MGDINLLGGETPSKKSKKKAGKSSADVPLTHPEKEAGDSSGLRDVKKSSWGDMFKVSFQGKKNDVPADKGARAVGTFMNGTKDAPAKNRELLTKPQKISSRKSDTAVKDRPVLSKTTQSKKSFWSRWFGRKPRPAPPVKPLKISRDVSDVVSPFEKKVPVQPKRNGFTYGQLARPGMNGLAAEKPSSPPASPAPVATKVYVPHKSFLPKAGTTPVLSAPLSVPHKKSFWQGWWGGKKGDSHPEKKQSPISAPPGQEDRGSVAMTHPEPPKRQVQVGVTSRVSHAFPFNRKYGNNGNSGSIDVNLVPTVLTDQPRRRARTLGIVALVTTVAVVVVYIGFSVYQFVLNNTNRDIAGEIQSVEQQLQQYNDVRLQAADTKKHVDAVEGLLTKHIYWSHLLDFLEAYTLDETFYIELSGDTGGRISLKAVTDSYQSVGRQLVALEKASEFVKDVSVREGSIQESVIVNEAGEQSGTAQRIIFTIDMTVDSDIFYFSSQDAE